MYRAGLGNAKVTSTAKVLYYEAGRAAVSAKFQEKILNSVILQTNRQTKKIVRQKKYRQADRDRPGWPTRRYKRGLLLFSNGEEGSQ
jgi:hypothetical protein